MEIRELKVEDIQDVARCHIKAFPSSLSSRLGLKYTKKSLEWYLNDKRAFLIWCAVDNKCVGYCGGLRSDGVSHGSTSSILQYTMQAAIIGLIKRPWLIFHPEIWKNRKLILKNFLRKFKIKQNAVQETKNSIKPNIEISVGIVGIAVLPSFQSKGIGTFMLKAFEARVSSFNLHRMHLSVRKNNFKAINAYKKNGWEIKDENFNSLSMIKII